MKNKDLPWKFRDHSLFVGYGPVKNPKFNISVVIDHGGSGSSKAAPIARKVMQKIFNKYYLKKMFSSFQNNFKTKIVNVD